jgi:hypothetical protein
MIAGRHDFAERKQALRKQREKGCSIYIAADLLQQAGIDPNGPAPFYRVWAGERGRFVVTLYGEK